MRSALFIVFAFVALAAAGWRGDSDRSRSDDWDVVEAQNRYNFRVDYLFGHGYKVTAEYLNSLLDILMQTFCPDGIFESWDTDIGFGGFTTHAQIREAYSYFAANIFANASQHQLGNYIVDFDSNDHAELTAYFRQYSKNVIPFGSDNPPQEYLTFGFYRTEWTKVRGEWCMSRFFTGNPYQGPFNFTDNINGKWPLLA